MFRRLAPLLVLLPLIPAGLARGAGDFQVSATNFEYTPKTATIPPGNTVVWTNEGGQHSVHFEDGGYDSGDPTTNADLGSRTFTEEGTYAYYCELHGSAGGGGMSGTVVVTNDPQPSPSPSPGASPTPSPGGSASPTPSPGPGGATPSPSPAPTAASPDPPVLTSVTFKRKARHGRLRGTVAGEPAGAELAVRVKRGRHRAGRLATTLGDEPTRVTVRLSRSVRTRLADGERVRVKVKVTLTSDGGSVVARRSLRLRAG